MDFDVLNAAWRAVGADVAGLKWGAFVDAVFAAQAQKKPEFERPTEDGWICTHREYGVWFMPRSGVVEDWKRDYAQYHGVDLSEVPEPGPETIETWWDEQTTWIEMAAYGRQIARADMDFHEARFLTAMKNDYDNLGFEGEIVEVGQLIKR